MHALEDQRRPRPAIERSRSVSSMRRMNCAAGGAAKAHGYSAERMLPRWMKPVGDGAKRVRTVAGHAVSEVSRPRARSALMSSTCSRPTATRIRPWPMPAACRCSSVRRPCEVVAGWRDDGLGVAQVGGDAEQTCGAVDDVEGVARAATRGRRPARRRTRTAPPCRDCWRIASACCGCDVQARVVDARRPPAALEPARPAPARCRSAPSCGCPASPGP